MQHTSDEGLARAADAIMGDACKADEPGAAVIVAREGRTVFRAGYGMATWS